jgi:proteic killer suppression protein
MSIVDNLKAVPDDLYPFPKLKPHQLKGDRQGEWAVSISANWRITFRFDNSTGTAYDLDLEDYH